MNSICENDSYSFAATHLINTATHAWRQGFLAGYSGNLSLRLDNGFILITGANTAKGRLNEDDLVIMTVTGDMVSGKRKPSSESGLHLAIYNAFPGCGAILHTHPAYLQALELKLPEPREMFLNIDIFEAQIWHDRLVWIDPWPPGHTSLAQATVLALQASYGENAPFPCAAWLSRHGLCALSSTLPSCLSLTEELEHIAYVQILTL